LGFSQEKEMARLVPHVKKNKARRAVCTDDDDDSAESDDSQSLMAQRLQSAWDRKSAAGDDLVVT
jgi:hypothetical protein